MVTAKKKQKSFRTAKLLELLRSRVNVGWDLEREDFIVVKQIVYYA